jgi:hypothetical protein
VADPGRALVGRGGVLVGDGIALLCASGLSRPQASTIPAIRPSTAGRVHELFLRSESWTSQ